MKHILAFTLCLCAISAAALLPGNSDMTLRYESPASVWEETLPLGNGRLGLMPDGGVNHDHIVLNEISMWSGSVADYSNPDAAVCLPRIRQLLFDGKNKEAQDLMYAGFVPRKPTEGGTYGTYQMLGALDLEFPHSEYTDYMRWLNLDEAIAYTQYSSGGVDYLRRYHVPRGADVMVVQLSASQPSTLTFSAALSRAENVAITAATQTSITIEGNLDSGVDTIPGMAYAAKMRVIPVGPKATAFYADGKVYVDNADEAWIIIGGETDYWGDLNQDNITAIDSLTPADLMEMRQSGVNDHRLLFGRAGLYLPRTDQSALPTDKRILAFAENDNDPELAALYYNYGRYLLICSTLPGNLPPNLQGLWTNGYTTPWNGDYHTNINVQMNHWPAEPSGLGQLHEPLIDLVRRAVPSGQRTAKAFYGPDARGWVMHMMTNPWQYTEPGEHPSWGATNTGGAWLCAHLWQHYLYLPQGEEADAYLRDIYPVMKGAADFFLSTMTKDPATGYMVTGPSSSPENTFIDPDSGEAVSICMAPTMDIQLLTELFGNVARAADILGLDSAYTDTLRDAAAAMPPMQIGSDGRLMEWMREYTETDPHHRHVSHLYGLHPASLITVDGTPELAEACRRSLDARGDGGTGWSRAWKINFWARLADGDRAYTLLRALLSPAWSESGKRHTSGTFPNLFCSHPPVQLDGNWGGSSGIIEMLLQTRNGNAVLLPALPAAWPDGAFYGWRIPGGGTVNAVWHDGKLTQESVEYNNF